jgi:hypothetical protein
MKGDADEGGSEEVEIRVQREAVLLADDAVSAVDRKIISWTARRNIVSPTASLTGPGDTFPCPLLEPPDPGGRGTRSAARYDPHQTASRAHPPVPCRGPESR